MTDHKVPSLFELFDLTQKIHSEFIALCSNEAQGKGKAK